jgi:hypothetical protein
LLSDYITKIRLLNGTAKFKCKKFKALVSSVQVAILVYELEAPTVSHRASLRERGYSYTNI